MTYLPNKGIVLTDNSSTTPLNNGDSYTGTWHDVSAFSSVTLACKTDQSGQLYAQFSHDGVTTDSSLVYPVQASTNNVHRLTVTRKYFRAVFTNNSGSNQTTFDLQCLAGEQTALNAALNATIAQDADAQVTRPIDFNLLLAQGKYAGHKVVYKDGLNADIDTGSTPEDIWAAGGTYTGFPISAAAASVVSTSASDTGTLYYSYLESPTSTAYVFGSVTLNGTTPVALGHDVWRCNYLKYDSGDDTTFNLGVISLYHTATPSNIFCTIQVGYSQSYCSAYTVPYGSSAYIDWRSAIIRGSTSGSVDMFFWWREYGISPVLRFSFSASFGARYFDEIDYLTKIPARTDIIPRCITASTNNLSVQVDYRIVEILD